MTGAPTRMCPSCRSEPRTKEALCPECWSKVPSKIRATIHRAEKAIGYNPASAARQTELRDAVAAAVAAVKQKTGRR